MTRQESAGARCRNPRAARNAVPRPARGRYGSVVAVLALLASPLLGEAVWRPVASLFGELGWEARVAHVGATAPASVEEALDGYLHSLPRREDLVLVPHSNAGLYVPAIIERRRVDAAVFVDAGLPPVEGGAVPVLPSEFYDMIASKADDHGVLPPWTQWWDAHEVDSLFPDSATRAAIEHDQRRLPLSYFEDVVEVRPGWAANCQCAYLGFGDGYAAEVSRAQQIGWPVRVLAGQHLEMTMHPRAVAEAILQLLDEAACRAPRGR